jgi:hypothetical protein
MKIQATCNAVSDKSWRPEELRFSTRGDAGKNDLNSSAKVAPVQPRVNRIGAKLWSPPIVITEELRVTALNVSWSPMNDPWKFLAIVA